MFEAHLPLRNALVSPRALQSLLDMDGRARDQTTVFLTSAQYLSITDLTSICKMRLSKRPLTYKSPQEMEDIGDRYMARRQLPLAAGFLSPTEVENIWVKCSFCSS